MDKCTKENEPMRVWPGTHTKEHQDQLGADGWEIIPVTIDYDLGIDLLVSPGTMIFFT